MLIKLIRYLLDKEKGGKVLYMNINKVGGTELDTGYSCWLGHRKIEDQDLVSQYSEWASIIDVINSDDIVKVAAEELSNAICVIMDRKPLINMGKQSEEGSIVLMLNDSSETDELGREGFLIKMYNENNINHLLISAKTGRGILYGIFQFIRLMQCGTDFKNISIIDKPKNEIRMINHWDNMDGSVERGYSGRSIFFSNNDFIEDLARIKDYSRLMASIGINSIAINNVNVHKVETYLIAERFLPKVKKIADIFRQYGVKLFLCANFAAPYEMGYLDTADPLDEKVQKWWQERVDEIYSYIPDFGGFVVKADSEFRPGPFTYGRNHAEGANMLAKALEPHNGLVIWRCFVYNCKQDWRDRKTDRANSAYDNFMPIDGQFMDNVILQIKNGPMDFQVREPVSPLFGGLENTNQILEVQIAQEYTGQQRDLCYLIPQWKEVLNFDTYAKGEGSTVKKIVEGSVFPQKHSGIAAVSNIGNNLNWTGNDLAQANLYGYGRLAWNTELSAEEIAEEWALQTFGNDKSVIDTVVEMLMNSWPIYEKYTTPLGIGWMVTPHYHYGPDVDGYEYAAWGTYHRADTKGLGVDRTVAKGTGYAGRYRSPNAEIFEDIETCPTELLLFFHNVEYKYKLKSGKTLIQHIYDTHFEGVEQLEQLVVKWNSLNGKVGDECFKRVNKRFEMQKENAKQWRDVINSYFFRKSGISDEKARAIF